MNFKMLEKPIRVDIREEVVKETIRLADEITENGQTFGRSRKKLLRHCLNGALLEITAKNVLMGSLNTKKFNHKDPDSYNYDVMVNGKKIEVKTHPRETWVNFNLRGYENANDEQLNRADYSTFVKHCDKLDFLLIGSVEKISSKIWEVKFQYVINAKTFKKYVNESMDVGTGTTHYYNQKLAIKEHQCLRLC